MVLKQQTLWDQFNEIPKTIDNSQWFLSKLKAWAWTKLYDFVKRAWDKARNNVVTKSLAWQFNQSVMESEAEKLKAMINPDLDTSKYNTNWLKTLQDVFSDDIVTKEESQKINSMPWQYRDLAIQSKNLQWLQESIYWWDFSSLSPEQQSSMVNWFEETYKTYQKHRDYLMTDDTGMLRSIDKANTVKDAAYKAYTRQLRSIVNENWDNRDLIWWLNKSFDTYFQWYYDREVELKASEYSWDEKLNKLLIEYRDATNDVLKTLLKEWKEYNKKDDVTWTDFYRDVLSKKPEVYEKFVKLDKKNRQLNINMMMNSWFWLDDKTWPLGELWQWVEAWRQLALNPIRTWFEWATEAAGIRNMTSLNKMQYISDEIGWTKRFFGNLKNWIWRDAFDITTFVADVAISWWVKGIPSAVSKLGKIGSLAWKLNKIDKLIDANKIAKFGLKFSEEAIQWIRIDSMFNYHFSPWISADTVMTDMVGSMVFDWASALFSTLKWARKAVSGKTLREYIKKFDTPEWNKLAMTLWYDVNNTAELIRWTASELPIALKKQHELLSSTVVDLSKKIKNVSWLGWDVAKKEMKEIRKDMWLMVELLAKYWDESSVAKLGLLWDLRRTVRNGSAKQLKNIADWLNNVVAAAMVTTSSKMRDVANEIARRYVLNDMVDAWLIKNVAENQEIYSNNIVEWLMRFTGDTTTDYWSAMTIAKRIQETKVIWDKDIIDMITAVGSKPNETARWYTSRLAKFFNDMVWVEPKNLTNLQKYSDKLDEVVKNIWNTMNKTGITIKFDKAKNAQFKPKQMAAIMSTLSSAYWDNAEEFVMAMMHEFSHWLSTFLNDSMKVVVDWKKIWIRTLIEKSYNKELRNLNKLFSNVLPEQYREWFNLQNIKEVTIALKNDQLMSLHKEEMNFLIDAMDKFHTRYANVEEYIAYHLSEQLLWKESKLPFSETVADYFKWLVW